MRIAGESGKSVATVGGAVAADAVPGDSRSAGCRSCESLGVKLVDLAAVAFLNSAARW